MTHNTPFSFFIVIRANSDGVAPKMLLAASWATESLETLAGLRLHLIPLPMKSVPVARVSDHRHDRAFIGHSRAARWVRSRLTC